MPNDFDLILWYFLAIGSNIEYGINPSDTHKLHILKKSISANIDCVELYQPTL